MIGIEHILDLSGVVRKRDRVMRTVMICTDERESHDVPNARTTSHGKWTIWFFHIAKNRALDQVLLIERVMTRRTN